MPPAVVATVTRREDLDLLLDDPGAAQGFEWLELRLDDLREHLDQAASVAARLGPGRVLVTARHPEEGGCGALEEDDRLAMLDRFLPWCGWMDLELRTLRASAAARALAARAREQGVRVLGSFHDFQGMPADGVLGRSIAEGLEFGLDAVKLAVRMERLADLFVVAAMVESSPVAVSAMGMGPLGKLSRLVLAKAGSILNYGYLRSPNAPGQWPASELRRLLDEV
jgi:3-dehydroquinate dehydratase-1